MPPERLQKILAAAGVASRRASEALIAAGRVTVDGRPAKLGDQADPDTARIEVDGHVIGGAAAPVHLAMHKPPGVTSTVRDPHADRTVLQLLPTALLPAGTRLYPVGRLDRDSEGLLLLTNDGPWAEQVLHPRFGIDREYAVGLTTWLTAEQRRALEAGIELEEGRAAFVHPVRPIGSAERDRLAALLDPSAASLAWYRVVLRQGWKRQVRRMFGAVGAPVVRLVRTRIGPVRLDDLAPGRFRRLRGQEIRALSKSAEGAAPPAASRRRPAGSATRVGPGDRSSQPRGSQRAPVALRRDGGGATARPRPRRQG